MSLSPVAITPSARILSGPVPAVLLGFTGGLAAASGNITLIALGAISAAAVSLCVLFPQLLLWGVFGGGLVAAGVTQLYLPQLQAIRWVVAGGAGALGAVALLFWLFSPETTGKPRIPAIIHWMIAFVAVGTISSLWNRLDAATYVFGLKGYAQAWGFVAAVTFLPLAVRFVEHLPWAMLIVALSQLPFVAHQYLVLAPMRQGVGHGVVPEDVIAGTLGADLEGGGANAVLSALLFIVVSGVVALWKHGVISRNRTLALSAILLAPTVLNLSKVSAVYLALVFFVLFLADIRRFPGRVVAAAGAVGALAGGMLLLFSYMSVDEAVRAQGLSEVIVSATETHMSEDAGYGGFELNRWTSLTFWVQEHGWKNPFQTLFGHGLGQSREAAGGIGIATTLAQQRYPGLGIGLTAVSAVLWETGLVGVAILFAMFAVTFRAAGRLAARFLSIDRSQAAIFQGIQAGLSVLTLSLFHKNFMVMHLPFQMLVVVVFAYVAHFSATGHKGTTALAPAAPAGRETANGAA